MKEWIENTIGFWWLVVWRSEEKEIVVGVGPDQGDGCYGPFFINLKRWKCFWISVAKPTLRFKLEQERFFEKVKSNKTKRS